MTDLSNRRPLKSRGSAWARSAAAALARAGVRPDVVSALGVAFAALGGALFLLSGASSGVGRVVALALAALCVQARLVCNLLDGMVAVEHGRGSSAGPIWNELPDRFSDAFLLVGAGYGARICGAHGAEVAGWIAAVAAVTTAYVRELGRGLGFAADFSGPMAKPQRMATLTVAAVVSIAEPLWHWRGGTMRLGLAIIALGALFTIGRRTLRLAAALRTRAGEMI
ncbi:MAG TPA: CDP-alcohol phosphatidyltransferase family protein [Caulobacteraceae bacterium]|nr:CDP-alcohol phosphatidyltransferase family protein [Caulobacteraceae bacterium]